MKKFAFIYILISIVTTDSFGCNVCGCGVGSYHYGILPQFQKNFIGFRYRYRTYHSHLGEGHASDHSYETFRTTELWARLYPTKRIQAFIFIPYNMNFREEGTKTTRLEGLGDIVLSANYNVFNTYDSTALLKHNLLIGAGAKLPTGKFGALDDGRTINQNFQLGTGSVDALLSLVYTVRLKRVGLNAEGTYSVNGTNKDDYNFGNSLQGGLNTFVLSSFGMVTVMPNIGLSFETFQDNKQYGEPFTDSGGWAFLYNAGIETYYKNIALGFSYSRPGRQELFNGMVSANGRANVHLTLMF